MRRGLLKLLAVAAVGVGGVVAALAVGATVFPSSGPITINDCCNNADPPDATGNPSRATPYPSNIAVANMAGTITAVKATIVVRYAFPEDLDILLVAPTGANTILMSDVGGSSNAFQPDTLTFQTGSPAVPESGELTSGSYSPTNGAADCDQTEPEDGFPAAVSPDPSPPTPSATVSMANFNGISPNGTWKLYVIDDCNGIVQNSDTIDSWSLDITTNAPTAVELKTFTVHPTRRGMNLLWRTAVEKDIVGFNVYRERGRSKVKVNRALVPSKGAGSLGGASYRVLDTGTRPGITYTYRLQAVGLDGRKSWAALAVATAIG